MFPVLGGAPGDALLEHARVEAEEAVAAMLPRCNASLGVVYRYWKGLARAGGAPRRAAFDPMAVAGALPDIFLVAVEGGEYRFTVVGGRIEERLGARLTQRRLAGCAGLIDVARTRRDFDAMVADPRPRLERMTGEWALYEWRRYERLMLPLADDAGALSHILGAIDLCMEDRPSNAAYLLCEQRRS